jgi:hypothetical protein
MGLFGSILVIALGAVFVWGLSGSVAGVEVDTIGLILIIIGGIGALLSLVFWSSWGGFGGRAVDKERTIRH